MPQCGPSRELPGVWALKWWTSMARTSKGYSAAAAKVDRERQYPVAEALALARQTARAKFDETVAVAVRIGVDPRKADQNVRGTVILPHGIRQTVRLAVVAQVEQPREAGEAGGDEEQAERRERRRG